MFFRFASPSPSSTDEYGRLGLSTKNWNKALTKTGIWYDTKIIHISSKKRLDFSLLPAPRFWTPMSGTIASLIGWELNWMAGRSPVSFIISSTGVMVPLLAAVGVEEVLKPNLASIHLLLPLDRKSAWILDTW
jgi:hypothetical protein